MRGVVIVIFLCVGVLASIASTPGSSADISGQSGSFSLTLDAPGDSHDSSASATLDANAPLAAGSGEVGLTVQVDESSVGQLTFSITSDVTGDSNSTDILDPVSQPSARIAIAAFEGCSGTDTCGEDFSISFARIDDDDTGPLSLSWELDGFASTESRDADTASGTLEFSVQE